MTPAPASRPVSAETVAQRVAAWRAELVVEGFDVPWSLAFLPDGRMLVTDRIGTLHFIKDGAIDPEPIAGVPKVWVRDEAGLMSVVAHPEFASNGWIYLSFSDPA